MARFDKAMLEALHKKLFPFHYKMRPGCGHGEATRVDPLAYPNAEFDGFEELCKERGIPKDSDDYKKIKDIINGDCYKYTSRKRDEIWNDIIVKYFPEARLGSFKKNSKRQVGDKSPYTTPTLNYKIDASKVVKIKTSALEEKLSIMATQWPSAEVEGINAFWDMVCFGGKGGQPRTIVCLENPNPSRGMLEYWNPTLYDVGGDYAGACYKVKEDTIKSSKPGLDLHELLVKYTGENGTEKDYKITLWHYKGWPDGSVPKKPEDFEEFVETLDDKTKATRLVVHCHAGAGRTGVLSACLFAHRTKEKNAAKIVENLRKFRTQMVQQKVQFDFVCKYILRNIYGKEELGYKADLGKYLEEHDIEI